MSVLRRVHVEPSSEMDWSDCGWEVAQMVRCGECKYFYSVGGDGHIGTCANDPEGMFTHKDWCCGDGKRRDNAAD